MATHKGQHRGHNNGNDHKGSHKRGHSGNKHDGHHKSNSYMGKGLLGNTPKALKARSKKKIVKQATHLMNKEYAGAFKDLDQQTKLAQAVADKRNSDNKYYLDWLTQQADQMDAHNTAANERLIAAQNQVQKGANEAMLQLRDKMVQQGYTNAGNVSKAGQYTGFDISADMKYGNSKLAAARGAANTVMAGGTKDLNAFQASNAAMANAANIQNQANLASALNQIQNARTKLQLEKGAKTAEEVARLLDQEIAKAQQRVGMRTQSAQLAMSKKQQKLANRQEKFNEKLQTKQFGLDKANTAHDNRLANRQASETHRHNKATEKTSRYSAHHSSSGGSHAKGHEKQQQIRTIKAVTKSKLKAYRLPKSRSELRKIIDALSRKAGAAEGVSDEKLASKVVRRMVMQAYRREHGGGSSGGGGHHRQTRHLPR